MPARNVGAHVPTAHVKTRVKTEKRRRMKALLCQVAWHTCGLCVDQFRRKPARQRTESRGNTPPAWERGVAFAGKTITHDAPIPGGENRGPTLRKRTTRGPMSRGPTSSGRQVF